MTEAEFQAGLAGPGIRDVIVMALTVAVTVGFLAVGLGGADLLGDLAARLPERWMTDSAQAEPSVAPAGIGVDLDRLAGRWRNEQSGNRVIVTAKGEVWSDVGTMEGAALPGHTEADFTFGDDTFFCAYMLTYRDDDKADWKLVDHSAQTACPSGLFRKAPAL